MFHEWTDNLYYILNTRSKLPWIYKIVGQNFMNLEETSIWTLITYR